MSSRAHAGIVASPGPLHRLGGRCKLLGTLAFVAVVVTTPPRQWWAFAFEAAVVVAVAVYARLPLRDVARRLTIELPFVAFALAMPFVGRAPTIAVAGLHLSEPGLWAAWGIIAKGTLGVAATIVLASTTSVPDLLAAFERLRAPRTLTMIASFMIRYADIVTDEMRRMNIARVSRGDNPRWLWQARAVGSSAGALFVRSYERGERVYLAMASRGFDGTLPVQEADERQEAWVPCLCPALIAAAVSLSAWILA
ncbi:MAG TPA: cobalt ECF transporter T component CbiQ [Ilumatobacteraceae bacterium]